MAALDNCGSIMSSEASPFAVQWDGELDEPYIPVSPEVRLTPIRTSDLEQWLALHNSPDISRSSIRKAKPYPREHALRDIAQTLDHARTIISRFKAGEAEKGIEDCPFEVIRAYPSGDIMGVMHFYRGDPVKEWDNETWDVGYNMLPEYRGKGMTKAALNALIEGWVKPVMKIKRISAGSRAENTTSHAVLKSCGFVKAFDYERTLPPELGGSTFPCIKWMRDL